MKRNLFDELNEGLQALRDDREGKITLKKYSAGQITAPELKSAHWKTGSKAAPNLMLKQQY